MKRTTRRQCHVTSGLPGRPFFWGPICSLLEIIFMLALFVSAIVLAFHRQIHLGRAALIGILILSYLCGDMIDGTVVDEPRLAGSLAPLICVLSYVLPLASTVAAALMRGQTWLRVLAGLLAIPLVGSLCLFARFGLGLP